MRSIPLIWWHHLDGNSVSRSCWLFRLSLDRFWPQGPFTLNQILVSTHAPQFWNKMILFQNYLSRPLHVLHSSTTHLDFHVSWFRGLSHWSTSLASPRPRIDFRSWCSLPFDFLSNPFLPPIHAFIADLLIFLRSILSLSTVAPVIGSLDQSLFLPRSQVWSIN